MTEIWVSACLLAAVAAAGLGAACAFAGLRMPGRTLVAAPAMVVMAVTCADMVLPGVQLLGPLSWAGLLVGAALLALLDRRHRMPAAHHAAALLLMAVMWVAMLPAASASSSAQASAGGAGGVVGSGSWAATGAAASAGAAASTEAAASGGAGAGAGASTEAAASGGAGAGATAAADTTAATGAGPAAGNNVHAEHALAIIDGGTLLAGLVVLVAAASVALAASAVRTARRKAGLGVTPGTHRLESAQHLSMALAMTLMAAGMFLPLAGR
ncbi:hypothetical protein E3T28_07810 [Cryobacterium sinapicolor]|uniref:DUF5134 domain-containing protein n=1 Tax=Cryobacterium sinapicolor TaxID=1259236 RepID=A0ABY2JAX2_9MICO|nr:hypothetical protein [Cryobacterium sinapicolor]TFD00981.1 hypothetical protein E3T28_07810 [Cryobacterium sinapicolor]